MRAFILLLAWLATPAMAQNTPCYWSGNFVQCWPSTGILLDGQKSLRLGDATTNYVELKAANSVTSYTVTWPAAQGANNASLVNNGSGTLTWSTTPGTQANATTNGWLASGDWVLFNGAAPTARTISTTAPLTGGGDLTANRTLAISAATSGAAGSVSAEATGSVSSTFTFNGSGGTSGSKTLTEARSGNVVCIRSDSNPGPTTGTGSTALTSNTALDTWARPAATQYFLIATQSNGTALTTPGLVSIGANGIITLNKDPAGSAWPNSTANSGYNNALNFCYQVN